MSIKEQIAELRTAASRLRISAQHADRNSDYQAEMRLADVRDQEANRLEAELLETELNGGCDE